MEVKMVKYDSMRKLKRNEIIRQYAATHSKATLVEIGEIFRISRQRVYTILKKSGVVASAEN